MNRKIMIGTALTIVVLSIVLALFMNPSLNPLAKPNVKVAFNDDSYLYDTHINQVVEVHLMYRLENTGGIGNVTLSCKLRIETTKGDYEYVQNGTITFTRQKTTASYGFVFPIQRSDEEPFFKNEEYYTPNPNGGVYVNYRTVWNYSFVTNVSNSTMIYI